MKFSIRDLLLVTVIVALAVGWGVDRFKLTKKTQEAEELVKVLSTKVRFDSEHVEYLLKERERLSRPSKSAPNPPKK